VLIVAVVVGVGILKAWWSLPFSPLEVSATQPIEFPHDVHADTLGIDCLFCHRTVDSDEAASIPAVQQCMFCHQVVKKDSPEVSKLVSAFENDEPINWIIVAMEFERNKKQFIKDQKAEGKTLEEAKEAYEFAKADIVRKALDLPDIDEVQSMIDDQQRPRDGRGNYLTDEEIAERQAATAVEEINEEE